MVRIINSLIGKTDGSCIAFIFATDYEVDVHVVDCNKNEFLPKIYSTKPIALKQFLNDFSRLFGSKLKAVIVKVYELMVFDFESSFELCKSFKEKFDALKISSFFPTGLEAHFSGMISAAKIGIPKIGDHVVIAVPQENTEMFEFKFTKFGWNRIDGPFGFVETQRKIDKIKYILIRNDSRLFIDVILLKAIAAKTPQKLILCENNPKIYMKEYMIETEKWMKDKENYVKKFIIPKIRNGLLITSLQSQQLLSFQQNENAPATKSCIIPKSMTHLLQSTIDSYRLKGYTEAHIMNQKCHRIKLTISADENSIFTFNVEGIMLPKIESLPKILNEKIKSKIPIIAFCDDFSVLCVYHKGGYKFADGWNGVYGNLNFINFAFEEPKFGENAINPLQEWGVVYDLNSQNEIPTFHETYISQPLSSGFGSKDGPKGRHHEYHIFDLIKIMSMHPNNFKIKKSWPFEVSKVDKDEIMLGFCSHGEIPNGASPSVLMAMLLNEQIKITKSETGENPSKFGFCILNEKYAKDEKERIKEGLKKACEYLKIGYDFLEV